MKTLTIGLLTASLLFVLAGCADEDESSNPGPGPEQVQVSVSVNPDTIWFVYGDPEVAEIVVQVRNGDGQPLADKPVMVHVSDPNLGEVDFELMGGDHSTAWDTTNSDGRAVIPYLAVRSGDNSVTAVVEGDTAQTVAIGRHPYNGELLTLNLIAAPSEWHFPSMGDTAVIYCSLTVLDELQLPVPGLTVEFHAQRGHVVAGPPTDENGFTQTWLTATEDEVFPDELTPEITGEVAAQISIFSDSRLILFRRGQG